MSTPDKNFCIVSQADDGTLWGQGGPFGPVNKMLHDASRPVYIEILGDLIPPDKTYADTLKVAHVTGEVLINVIGDIVGGYEDCIDATICKGNVTVTWTGFLKPTGNFVSTIKGETNGFTLRGKVSGHGLEGDIDLGNYFSANGRKLNNATKNVRLELTAPSPIKVRPLSADNPIILNPSQPYKIDKYTRYFYMVWLCFK